MDTPKEIIELVEDTPIEVAQEEKIKLLEIKLKAMETLANQYKNSIPNLLQIGRPIHLSLVFKGFLYQFIVPEGALADTSQFSDVHSILSKFGVLISNIETDSAKQKAAMQAKAEQIKLEQVKKED
jgi:hypothetical protein